MRLVTLPGVLRPPSDSWLLAGVLDRSGLARDASVLDLFTGSGILAIAASQLGARAVTAVDISRRAVFNTRINARLNGAQLRALRGDLFAPVAGTRFDVILANPPYLPSEHDDLPTRGAARAWDGGRDGRALIDRMCDKVADHLAPGGRIMMVHSALCGEEATLSGLRAAGLGAAVLARQQGTLGPILSARARMLEERGLLRREQRDEEMLVIEGACSDGRTAAAAAGAVSPTTG